MLSITFTVLSLLLCDVLSVQGQQINPAAAEELTAHAPIALYGLCRSCRSLILRSLPKR